MDRTVLSKKGFTLIEVIVVAAIIAILAGILVPMIFSQIDESKITRAKGDVDSISKAILTFKADTGVVPMYTGGTYPCNLAGAGPATHVTMLKSSGSMPGDYAATGAYDETTVATFSQVFTSNPGGCYTEGSSPPKVAWKGPYLTTVEADPWGNAYMINTSQFNPATSGYVTVLSAGPDGILQSAASSTSPVGDDIMKVVK